MIIHFDFKICEEKIMVIYTKLWKDCIETIAAIVVEFDHEICYKHI